MYKTHLAFGLLVGLLALNFFNGWSRYFFLVFVLIGSILPDIDMPKSKISRKVKPLAVVVNLFTRHRGIFHTIFPAILIFFVAWVFNQKVIGYGLLVGYLSHLLIDGLTEAGINFLHPFANLRLQGFVRTGSIVETCFFLGLVLLDVVKIIRLF